MRLRARRGRLLGRRRRLRRRLALTDGADGILHGAEHETEYLANLPVTPPAGEFVRTFIERIGDYSVHVRGHPPGFVLVLKFFDGIGIGGGWSTAMLSVAGTAVVPLGVLVTFERRRGRLGRARRAVPRRRAVPVDGHVGRRRLHARRGVAVAVAAIGLRQRGAGRVVAAAVAGLLLGGLLFLTYGGAVFLRRCPSCSWSAVAGLPDGVRR